MVVITIIGWYGTETIGDRAIFAGLLRVFSECFDEYMIKWGSIIPHVTQRTLLEDHDFYLDISNNKLKGIEIFDSLSLFSLKKCIKISDILAIGGGPLMDIPCMHMLEYAMKYARKNKVRTYVLGCGWGPLKQQEYIRSAMQIVRSADVAIFRDEISLKSYQQYDTHKNVQALIDPAFFAAQYYIEKYPQSENRNYIAVNFRDLTIDSAYDSSSFCVDGLSDFVSRLLDCVPEKPVKFIPMHTFFIGGDDRIILEKVCNKINSERITVQHKPLSLIKTMEIYKDALFCVGMRFHSIVLQSVVNGYNYVLDYTDPEKGKIVGMIEHLGLKSQLNGRYISFSQLSSFSLDTRIPKLIVDKNLISKYFEDYIHLIRCNK